MRLYALKTVWLAGSGNLASSSPGTQCHGRYRAWTHAQKTSSGKRTRPWSWLWPQDFMRSLSGSTLLRSPLSKSWSTERPSSQLSTLVLMSSITPVANSREVQQLSQVIHHLANSIMLGTWLVWLWSILLHCRPRHVWALVTLESRALKGSLDLESFDHNQFTL